MIVPDAWAYSAPGIVAAFFAGIAAILGAINKGTITEVKKDVVAVKKEVVSVKATGEANHLLSNSAFGDQLKATLAALTALSISQHRHAANGLEAEIAAAKAIDVQVEAARIALDNHLAQQAIVDLKAKESK